MPLYTPSGVQGQIGGRAYLRTLFSGSSSFAGTAVIDGTGQTGTAHWCTASGFSGGQSYQWKEDGSNVGTNSPSYTGSASGKALTCVVTEGGNTATSNTITTSWVATLQDGTRALLHVDGENDRAYYNGTEYASIAAFVAANSWATGLTTTLVGKTLRDNGSGLPFPFFNTSYGTFVLDASVNDTGATVSLLSVGAGATTNQIAYQERWDQANDPMRLAVTTSGTTVSVNGAAMTAATRTKLWFKYHVDDCRAMKAGDYTRYLNPSVALPAMDRIVLGANNAGAGAMTGTLYSVAYFPGNHQGYDFDLFVGAKVLTIAAGLAENDALDALDIFGDGYPAIANIRATGTIYLFRQQQRGVFTQSLPYSAGDTNEIETTKFVNRNGDGNYVLVASEQDGKNLLEFAPPTPGNYSSTSWVKSTIAGGAAYNKIQGVAPFTLSGDDRPTVFYSVEGSSGVQGFVGKARYASGAWTNTPNLALKNGAWWIYQEARFADGRILFTARANAHPAPDSGVYIFNPADNSVETIISSSSPYVDWCHAIIGDFFGNGNEDVAAQIGFGSSGGGAGDQNFYLFNSASAWAPTTIDAGSAAATRYNLVNMEPALGQINGRDPIFVDGDGIAKIWGWNSSAWAVTRDFTAELEPLTKFDGGMALMNLSRKGLDLVFGDSAVGHGRLMALRLVA